MVRKAMREFITDQLKELIHASRATEVGLAAHRISSGEEILIGADRAFHPASTFKLCVMMEVFRQIRLGRCSLEDPIAIKNEFASLADGSRFSLDIEDDSETDLYHHVGQTVPLGELVNRMITMSSNLATNILLEQVTPQAVSQFMKQLGEPDLVVRRGVEDDRAFRLGLNNSATARAFVGILLRLAKGLVVCQEDSDAMIEILANQYFNQMIPAGLPAGIRVAHKGGWNADYHHDVGIIYPRSGLPIVLAILTKGYTEQADAEAHAFIASLARAIYDGWEGV
jgi:beta-lactamase class A